MATLSFDSDLNVQPVDPERAAWFPEVGAAATNGGVRVEVFARAALPTRFGEFVILVFRSNVDSKEHVALVRGHVRDAIAVPTRLHSECLTGDVLGSMRCDCREQLEHALKLFGEADNALLLYMRQEGRGIGLGNKIRAYALQEQGLDTVAANEHLGFDDDLRDYRIAALMTRLLCVGSVDLLTNNPRKILGLRQLGVSVANRVPIIIPSNSHNERYLSTKARRSGHMLSPPSEGDDT